MLAMCLLHHCTHPCKISYKTAAMQQSLPCLLFVLEQVCMALNEAILWHFALQYCLILFIFNMSFNNKQCVLCCIFIFGKKKNIYFPVSRYEWQAVLKVSQLHHDNMLILPGGFQDMWESPDHRHLYFIFFMQVKLVEVVSHLPYVTIYHMMDNSDFQEKVISSIIFVFLKDEDVRVRHAAAKAIVR